ncbi:hypothetical protein ACLFMI_21435 [Pseudonocardia nantongensis]
MPLIVAGAVLAGLAVGRYSIHPFEITRILLGQVLPLEQTWSPTEPRRSSTSECPGS